MQYKSKNKNPNLSNAGYKNLLKIQNRAQYTVNVTLTEDYVII